MLDRENAEFLWELPPKEIFMQPRIFEPAPPRCYIVFDVESAVIDVTGHKRYQAMERWRPSNDDAPSRRGYKRNADPLKTPRWPFQSIVAASIMVMREHPNGNLEVSRFITMSAPDHTESEIAAGILRVFAEAPAEAELVSWAGAWHDVPMLVCAALKHGHALPKSFGWMAWGGDGRVKHIDLCRVLTGGAKMKPVHMSEYVAALNIPAKMTAPAFMVTKFIYDGRWEQVQEICEGDVITTALLLARWRRLLDPRAEIAVVEDRIIRQIEELRAGRSYLDELHKHRLRLHRAMVAREMQEQRRLEQEARAA